MRPIRVCRMAVLFLPFLLLCTPITNAAEEEEEDNQLLNELFQSETVYPQDQGEIQFTFVPEFRAGMTRNRFLFPFLVEFGLTDAWQVELEWTAHSIITDPRKQGIGELAFGTMYSFLNIGGSTSHAAAGFEVEIPLGDVDKELSEGFLEYETFVVLAHDFPQFYRVQVFTQFGLTFVQRVDSPMDPDDKEPAAHEFLFNTGFIVPWECMVFTGEFNWTTNEWNHDGTESQQFFTPGVKWVPSTSREIGIGVPIGLNSETDDYRIIVHFLQEFDLL